LLSENAFRLLPAASPEVYDIKTGTIDARWNEPIKTMLPNHDAGLIGVVIMDCQDPASPGSIQELLSQAMPCLNIRPDYFG
jgi:hypothetical protein